MLPELVLQAFSDCVAERTGMHFGRDRWADLQRAADALTGGHDAAGQPAALLQWLAHTGPHAQTEWLARHLAVGETYFFREANAFEALEHDVLPAIIAARRREGRRCLRLWSAGCCTGEEAYSLAIVLARAIPDLADWDLRILATDIHRGFIEQAQQGVYGDWSFRGMPDRQRLGHFLLHDGPRRAVRPELRRLVHFRQGNLLDAPAEGAFDIVLCRHVLMYFGLEHARQTVQRLRDALVDGGWLLVGPAEGSNMLQAGFDEQRFGDAVFYRKAAPAVQPTPPSAAPTPSPPLMRRGDTAEALAGCEAALAADKCDPVLHYLHALLLERSDDVAGARRALRRALFLDGRFVLAHVSLARLCEREGRRDLAQRHVDHALHALNAQPPGASAAATEPERDTGCLSA